MDCSIVSTHLILAATSLGVDSVWVRSFDPNEVKSVFNLDSSLVPFCLIALGHRAKDCPKNHMHEIRKPLDETVFYV